MTADNQSDSREVSGQTRISVWTGYLATIAIELVLTRILIFVHQFVPLGQFPIYHVLAIMFVAYVFGEGPAILAFFLGLLAFDYFFVPPLYTPFPHAETSAAWASLIAYLVGTSIVGFSMVMIRRSRQRAVREIAERKKAEEALETARKAAEYGKSRLEAVLEALPVGMAITDAKGGIVMVNKAYEQLWSGHPSTKSIKDYAAYKAWWVDTGEPVAPEEWASAQAVLKGKAVTGQLLEIQRFDGSRAFVINSASPIRDASGNIVGSAVAIQDITALREAEEALREEQQHKLEFYQRTILAATDGKLEITEADEILKIAGEPTESWDIRLPDDIATIRHGVQAIAESMGMDEQRIGQLVVAVGEAATNAFKHAIIGKASAHARDGALTVVITDRGPGIPALALPDVALTPGYSTAGTLGMGYKLIISFADKVYLATGAEGTTVGIQMRL